jgi:hypothetical protein
VNAPRSAKSRGTDTGIRDPVRTFHRDCYLFFRDDVFHLRHRFWDYFTALSHSFQMDAYRFGSRNLSIKCRASGVNSTRSFSTTRNTLTLQGSVSIARLI